MTLVLGVLVVLCGLVGLVFAYWAGHAAALEELDAQWELCGSCSGAGCDRCLGGHVPVWVPR